MADLPVDTRDRIAMLRRGEGFERTYRIGFGRPRDPLEVQAEIVQDLFALDAARRAAPDPVACDASRRTDGRPQPGISEVLGELAALVARNESRFAKLHNAHEALGKLAEEVRELEGEVFVREENRAAERMRREALDVAGICIRLIRDIVDGGRIAR